MNLEPEITEWIALSESLYETGVDDSVLVQRDVYNRYCAHFNPPHPAGLHDRYDQIAGVPVRWYWTDDATDACIVYFHGGGFVVGGLESHDLTCAHLALNTRCRLVTVDYRMAPEHIFPAAFDDCYAVLQALQQSPAAFGIDAQKIVLCGDSAGGNLTAAVALANRDRGGLSLRGQIMIYPRMSDEMSFPSYTECADAPLLATRDVEYYHRIYTGGEKIDSPYLSPATSHRFTDLPPALLMPVEYDPLRDDALDYHKKLMAAGVKSELHLGKGLVHGCIRALKISPGVQMMYARMVNFVRRAVDESNLEKAE
ncbi:MAG: alpha/beta hydrolase [Pseudomonadota bacterium]